MTRHWVHKLAAPLGLAAEVQRCSRGGPPLTLPLDSNPTHLALCPTHHRPTGWCSSLRSSTTRTPRCWRGRRRCWPPGRPCCWWHSRGGELHWRRGWVHADGTD